MQFVVKDNVKQFSRKLDLVQKRQVPFATSRALNDTAVKCQENIVINIQHRFNNRMRWYVKGSRRTGIRVEFSSKKRLPMKAEVYTNAYFAELQEQGGVKAPVSGKALALPTTNTPRKLHKSHGVRLAKADSAVFVDKRGVFKRMRKGKLKLLFTWARSAQIRPRFRFEQTAATTAKRWFPRYFEKRLQQALSTMKL